MSCPYCDDGPALADFAYKIGDMSEYSTLYLFKEQSHPGRLVVAFKGHKKELCDLSPEELSGHMADVARAAALIQKLWRPDKINYGAYGDLLWHHHFHLVPKYKDNFEWGGTFHINPHEHELTDAEAEVIVGKIKEELGI